MHEISLVRNIFSTLEEEFPNKTKEIKKIYVKAGLLSNVQPILMQNAFNVVKQDEPKYANISLDVEVVPIKIKCENCGTISEVEKYKFICTKCGKPSNNLIQGDELLISKVEFYN